MAGENNIADLATHPGTKLSDLGPDSAWQRGPLFLSLRRDFWPVSRSFVKVDLPDQELRTMKSNAGGWSNVFAAVIIYCWASKTSNAKAELQVESSKELGSVAWDSVIRVSEYSNSFKKVLNILARVTRGWKLGKTKDVVSKDPIASELQLAERLMLLSAMPASYTALNEDKLESLMPKKDGLLLVTTGRIGEASLSRLLGVACLPILMPNTRAAYLYMMRAHCGDSNLVHKSAVETLARSRSAVWIL